MSDKGTPHNIGQAFFESLGKGLSALPGILEQERQKQMQNLQLQMEQERHAINVENAQIGLEQSRAGMSEYIRRAGMDLGEKAEEDREIEAEDIRFALEQLNPLSGMPVGLGGFPEDAGLGQLQGILGAQGIDTSFSIGPVDFESQPAGIDRAGQAADLGLEPTGITKDGTIIYGRAATGAGERPLSAKDKIVWDALNQDPIEFTHFLAGTGRWARGAKDEPVDKILEMIEGIHPLSIIPSPPPATKPTLKNLKREALVNRYGEEAVRDAELFYTGDKNGVGAFSTAPFEEQEELLKKSGSTPLEGQK